MVRQFLTRDLRQGATLAAVEDYVSSNHLYSAREVVESDLLCCYEVANAASDLLLFALFSLLAPATRSLPFYTVSTSLLHSVPSQPVRRLLFFLRRLTGSCFQFGRDTRTIQSFQSELEDLGPSQKKSPRLRRLASAFAVIGDTKLSFPARLAQLEKVVDGAGGLK